MNIELYAVLAFTHLLCLLLGLRANLERIKRVARWKARVEQSCRRSSKVSPDILTTTGEYLNFLQPRPDAINATSIARGLSNCCRFAGQTQRFYSVAQHSVLASYIVPQEHAFAALMHDAAEAYVGDMTRPLKELIPDFREIEDRIQLAIASKFGFPFHQPHAVKIADLTLLATEQRDLMPKHDDEWALIAGVTPLRTTIQPWTADYAMHVWMARFDELAARRARRVERVA